MSSIPIQVSILSVGEKIDLLDALWQDIEAHSPTLSDEQAAELDRRLAGYERDRSAVLPWEQVKADLFKR